MAQLPPFIYNHIYSDPVRLMIREAHAIFSMISRDNVELARSNIITISRRYRSILHECVENLTADVTADRSHQIKTFKELEIIWNLCEVLILDVSQSGTLIIQLKNWIKMHSEELEPEAQKIMRSLESGSYQFTSNDVASTYWDLVLRSVVRGELKKATHLLKGHHEYESNTQLQLIVSMIERMPPSNQYIIHEFCAKFASWSEWCKHELECGQFDQNPAMRNIVRMFSQDKSVYRDMAAYCDTWYQLMIAQLLFTDPCIRKTDLPDLCRKSIMIHKDHSRSSKTLSPEDEELNQIIISAFEYDLIQVISRSCAYFDDNWWFVTHFVDLLHRSNLLNFHDIIEPDKMRDTFIQDYAKTLFDDDDLWAVGVSYLDSCGPDGIYHLEELLSRVYLDINDECKAQKLLALASKRGLTDLHKSICCRMARAWLTRTPRLDDMSIKIDKYKRTSDVPIPQPANLSNALYWSVKSGQTPLTTYISDQYLYYYCKTRQFPDESVFVNLKRSPINDERLAFLAKYHEFKQVIHDEESDLREAANLIRALLRSKVYPRFFCAELLEDAKELLKLRQQLLFTPDQTLDIMRSIEDITNDNEQENDIDLRKSLVQSMARALLTPSQLDN